MRICENQFKDHISRFSHILYLCHRNADPDAIGSSYALCQAFGGTIGAADDLSRTGDSLAKAIGAYILINPDVEDYDLVVVVDTSVRMQLGDMLPANYAIVDHHLDTGMLNDALFYIQRPANSTAEIVWKILNDCGLTIDRNASMGLLAGMISDTGRFKRATPEAFAAASDILAVGGFAYEEALKALSVSVSISQRIAMLKAASRAEIVRHGNWLISSTYVNSFEGSAAMTLVDLGSDVAFVAGKHGKGKTVRISARASREAARSGLNLAELLGEVAASYGGDGGGHRSAAAMEASGDPAAILKTCIKKAEDRLSQTL